VPRGGQNRVPTALKILAGNPGKRRLPEHEPQAKPAAPPMPDGMSAAAKAEWRRLVPELVALGVLTSIDRAALVGYCEAWSTYLRANLELAKPDAPLVQTTTGGDSLSAWLRVRSAAAKEMRDFATEFGLTPASRTRVAATKPKDPDVREATIASLVR